MLIFRPKAAILGCALLVCMTPGPASASLGSTEGTIGTGPGVMGTIGLLPDAPPPDSDPASGESADDGPEADAVEAGGLSSEQPGLDDPPAIAALRQAAGDGDAEAQYELATAYAVGNGVPRNPQAAAAWMEKAALQGFPSAVADLGILYLNGDGVPRNKVMACALLLAAVRLAAPAEIRPEVACGRLSADDRTTAQRIAGDQSLWPRTGQ